MKKIIEFLKNNRKKAIIIGSSIATVLVVLGVVLGITQDNKPLSVSSGGTEQWDSVTLSSTTESTTLLSQVEINNSTSSTNSGDTDEQGVPVSSINTSSNGPEATSNGATQAGGDGTPTTQKSATKATQPPATTKKSTPTTKAPTQPPATQPPAPQYDVNAIKSATASYVRSVGMIWDTTLHKGNSSWTGHISTVPWTHNAMGNIALQSKINEWVDLYKSLGYTNLHLYFESDGNDFNIYTLVD